MFAFAIPLKVFKEKRTLLRECVKGKGEDGILGSEECGKHP